MSLHLSIECDPDIFKDKLATRDSVSVEVSRLHTVAEISNNIYRELTDSLKHEQDFYGLYWSDKKMWLPHDKPIGRITRAVSRAKLEYRCRRRPITIRYLDGTMDVLLVDESKVVKEIVREICHQTNFSHPEELSLVVAVDYAITKHHPAGHKDAFNKSPSLGYKEEPMSPRNRRRSRPGSAGGGARPGSAVRKRSGSFTYKISKKKQMSRKHQIRIDTPWLDPNKTLLEQEVTDDDDLILMHRYYYNMHTPRMSSDIELLYKQARATFLAGELLCSMEEIPKFTALLCHIFSGNYESKENTQDILQKSKRLLIPPKCKSKSKMPSVGLWSTTNLFGMEFFSCLNMDSKDNGLIGISKHKQEKNIEIDHDMLREWQHDPQGEMLTMHFTSDAAIHKLTLHLPDYSSVLNDCLQGHRDIGFNVPAIQKLCQEFQFEEEVESGFNEYASHMVAVASSRASHDSPHHKRNTSVTYTEVYWANKIDNPLVSKEEMSSWKESSWENPVFENLEQLMEERFMFLDIEDEPSKNGSTPPIAPDSTTHHDSSPNSSPTVKSTSTGTNHTHHNPSPLLTTHLSGSLPKTDTVSQESSENESNSDTDVNITN